MSVKSKERENNGAIRHLVDKLRLAFRQKKHAFDIYTTSLSHAITVTISTETETIFQNNFAIIMKLMKKELNFYQPELEQQIVEILIHCKRELGLKQLPELRRHKPKLDLLTSRELDEVIDFDR